MASLREDMAKLTVGKAPVAKKKAAASKVTVKRTVVKSKKAPAKAKAPVKTATKKVIKPAIVPANATPVQKKAIAQKKRADRKEAAKKKPDKKVEKHLFPVGNMFWQRRSRHGVDGIWTSPKDLLEDCLEYFQWCEDNPMKEEKGFAYQGIVAKEDFNKMRVATQGGLCLHLGISPQTWINYRSRSPDFLEVVSYVEEAIKYQKFCGAAADLLNASIISRDLGLSDKTELTGAGGGPIQTITRKIVRVEGNE